MMCVPFCSRLLDIEYEMTNFAYYYVGIGVAVFLLGYLQVSLLNCFSLVFVKCELCKNLTNVHHF